MKDKEDLLLFSFFPFNFSLPLSLSPSLSLSLPPSSSVKLRGKKFLKCFSYLKYIFIIYTGILDRVYEVFYKEDAKAAGFPIRRGFF